MAYPLLQIVDDAGTVLFDLNDDTGANNAAYGSVKTWTLDEDFDLGSPDVQLSYSEPREAPGGTLVHQRHGLAQMTIRCSAKGTSVDNLRAGVGGLQKLLTLGGILKWQPDASSEVRYIDFLAASDIPNLWRGQGEEVISVFNSFADMEGLQLNLVRQPYLRGARLNFGNRLYNSTMTADATGNGKPDDWTDVGTVTSPSIVAAQEAAQWSATTTGQHGYYGNTNISTGTGQTYTAAADVRVVSGATGRIRLILRSVDGGGATLTEAGVSTTSSSFVRLTTTLTLPASHAALRVLVVADNDGAGTSVLQARRVSVQEGTTASPYHTGHEFVENDPALEAGRIFPVYIAGDAPTPVRMYINNSGPNDVTSVLVAVLASEGVTGKGALAEYQNAVKLRQLESGTLGLDTSSLADANASGGNIASVSYVTTPTNVVARSTVNFSGSAALSPLKGKTFDVYVRASHNAASTTSTLRLLAYHSSGATGPPITSPDVSFVSDASMANIYKDIKLGTVTFPTYESSGLYLTVSAGRTLGTGTLRLDVLTLVPVDESVSLVSVPSQTFTIGNDEVIYSDPETGFLERLGITDTYRRIGLILKGPQPVVLKPGLNLLYVMPGALNGALLDTSIRTQQLYMYSDYAPRYFH